MIIRRARPEDRPFVRRLAADLGLDQDGLEDDPVWVAETEEGRIAGLVSLLRHPDCLELVSLGVDPAARSAGLGGRLVEVLMTEAGGDVYLATVIPDFFERHGFRKASPAPAGMAKDAAWCEGCDKSRCTIMARSPR